jgi:hypothetical protein
MDKRNALLNMPSGYFLIEMHRAVPTESAANSCKLIQVESDFSPSKIIRLIHNKAATGEFEVLVIRIPV